MKVDCSAKSDDDAVDLTQKTDIKWMMGFTWKTDIILKLKHKTTLNIVSFKII